MPTDQQFVVSIFSSVIHIGLIIAIITSSIKLNQYRHRQAIQKRYPLLLQLMTFCCILYLMFQLARIYSFIYEGTASQFFYDQSLGNTFSLISTILYSFSLHGMMIMLIARSWFIYFNIKYGTQMQVRSNNTSDTLPISNTCKKIHTEKRMERAFKQ